MHLLLFVQVHLMQQIVRRRVMMMLNRQCSLAQVPFQPYYVEFVDVASASDNFLNSTEEECDLFPLSIDYI